MVIYPYILNVNLQTLHILLNNFYKIFFQFKNIVLLIPQLISDTYLFYYYTNKYIIFNIYIYKYSRKIEKL